MSMAASGLHVHAWGSGDRVALLLHGQFGDGLMWWEVAPAIAARGYRVVAPDLPGHGRSPRDPRATLASTVDAVLNVCPAAEVAIGQSLGGLVLVHAAAALGVSRAIYVDVPLRLGQRVNRYELPAQIEAMKAERTVEWLERERPHWNERDRQIEAEAAERFDVQTAVSLSNSLVGEHRPSTEVLTLAIVPDPSGYLSPADIEILAGDGAEIRRIPGVGHTVWYGHVPQFLAALQGWI